MRFLAPLRVIVLTGTNSTVTSTGTNGKAGLQPCHFLLVAAVALLTMAAHAQTPPEQTPPLQPNPALAMRQFEPDASQPYELGRGDAIAIDFAGRTELNSKQTIGPDGKITLPLAGSVAVADQTREQAAQSIVAALTPFYSNLSATVGVDKYTSNQVLLLGSVERPGVQTFDRAPTLLEVIAKGGGTLGSSRGGSGSDGGTAGGAFNVSSNLRPVMGGVPERVAIYRGSDKVLWVNLKQLLDSGDSLADVRLKRDDIVYVPSGTERYISVLGQVQHPGALQLEDSSTLAKLIALSGGLTAQAGRDPKIQIISTSTGKTRVIPFAQVLQPQKLDLTLHTGDIVYIPQSGFNAVSYTIDKLSPLVTMFTTAALITR